MLSGRRLVGSAVPPASKLVSLLERCPNLRVMKTPHARALAKRVAVRSAKQQGSSAKAKTATTRGEDEARRLASIPGGGPLGDAPALGKMLPKEAPQHAGATRWALQYRQLAAFCAARGRLPLAADFQCRRQHDARLGPQQRLEASELYEWMARNRAMEGEGMLGKEQRAQLAALGVFSDHGSHQEEEGET